MTIIGCAGKKLAGKDTLSDMLVAEYGFVKLSFAGPLKQAAKMIWGFTDRQLHGDLKEEPDPRYPMPTGRYLTPRKAMQDLGTEYGRKLYPNVWVDALMRTIDAHPPEKLWVVSDVRFISEAEAIHYRSGHVVEMLRDVSHKDEHKSEEGLPASLVDTRIDNTNTTVEEFLEKGRKAIEWMRRDGYLPPE